jgi:LacI family transcriptional regulator
LKKKLSIHDITRELNVSPTITSFVLNGATSGKKVSEPVRKKILDYVEGITYKPNVIAQTLRTGESKIIAILVEGICDPFFSCIGRIVEDNLQTPVQIILFQHWQALGRKLFTTIISHEKASLNIK